MNARRASLLTALLGLIALLIAWCLRTPPESAQKAEERFVAAESRAKPSPKRDFPRRPPPEDSVFPDGGPDDMAADVEHPWAAYLRTCAAAKKKLENVKVDLDQDNATLGDVVTEFERQFGERLNLDVPAETQDKRISFKVRDLSGYTTLRLLLSQYGCRWVVGPGGEIWVEPESENPSIHQPEFAVDLKRLQEISASVLAPATEKANEKSTVMTNNAMSSIKISLNFTDTPLPEVISFMQEVTQLNLMIDRKSIEDPESKTVTFKVDEMPFDQALDIILKLADLGYTVHNGVIVLKSKETLAAEAGTEAAAKSRQKQILETEQDLLARPVAFGGENLRLRDVAEILAKGLGVPYVIDPGTWARKAHYTIEERQRPASGIVALLKKGAPVIVAYREGILWFLSPDGVK